LIHEKRKKFHGRKTMLENLKTINEICRQRIKQLRKDHYYSLEKIGGVCGVGKTTVRKWENGQIINMKIDNIQALADFYHVDAIWLFGLNVPKEKEAENYVSLRKKLENKISHYSDNELEKIETFTINFIDKNKQKGETNG
jgi:transcriptional regulator with XRE-family HTH domain